MQMVNAGDFYIGVDEETGKLVLVPVQTVSLFFSNYASEHVLEVGTEHYQEMQDWHRDTRCYWNMSGLNRFGVIVTDSHEVVKCYRGEVRLSLEEAREAREQENQAYLQAHLDKKLVELRAGLAKDEGPYPTFLIYSVGREYEGCAGYEEAEAIRQEMGARNQALDQQARDQRLAKEQAEREAGKLRAQAKKEWIAQHGSPLLRKKFKAGYDCQRQYVQERARQEFPGYTIDLRDNAEWDERYTPSDEAFLEAERVGGNVVWLTKLPSESDSEDDEAEWSTEPFKPCEAVAIREYLGSYDLIRLM